MASAFSHVVVAGSLGVALRLNKASWRFWVLGAACSILPDLDVIGHGMGVPYAHPLGHRGLTHSLAFAALVSLVVVRTCFRGVQEKAYRPRLFLYFFLATASHGILDAMTNGGLGVAFFAPLDNTRYFLPFRPIEVSPISIQGFMTARGMEILASEVIWVWLPASLIALGFALKRRFLLKRPHISDQ